MAAAAARWSLLDKAGMVVTGGLIATSAALLVGNLAATADFLSWAKVRTLR